MTTTNNDRAKEINALWRSDGYEWVGTWAHKDSETHLVKGVAFIALGRRLLEEVDCDVESTIDIYSDRRVQMKGVNARMLEACEDEDGLVGECAKQATEYARMQRIENARGEDAIQRGDAKAMKYHFAREYALSQLVKGAYHITMFLKAEGGKFPHWVKVNIEV